MRWVAATDGIGVVERLLQRLARWSRRRRPRGATGARRCGCPPAPTAPTSRRRWCRRSPAGCGRRGRAGPVRARRAGPSTVRGQLAAAQEEAERAELGVAARQRRGAAAAGRTRLRKSRTRSSPTERRPPAGHLVEQVVNGHGRTGGEPDVEHFTRPPARGRVAAAARLGAGQPPEHGEALAGPVAVVDAVHDAEVLGQQDVPRIGRRQRADHLDQPRHARRRLLPRLGVADHHVGEVGAVERRRRRGLRGRRCRSARPCRRSCGSGSARIPSREPPPELGVVHRLVDQLLPAAGVDQDAVATGRAARASRRCSQTMNVKPKIRNGLPPCRARKPLTASRSSLPRSSRAKMWSRPKFIMPSTPAPRALERRVAHDRAAVDDQHRQPPLAEHRAQRRGQHARSARPPPAWSR